MRTSDRGFSYLLLLFATALGGVLLAAAGEHWQVAMQRERETELLFRGHEIRRAIESYQAAAAGGVAQAPERLEDLLEDRRWTPPRHHLRRLYTDPFTGAPDWVVLRDPAGRIAGVHSRSRQSALRREGVPWFWKLDEQAGAERRGEVGEWWFVAHQGGSARP